MSTFNGVTIELISMILSTYIGLAASEMGFDFQLLLPALVVTAIFTLGFKWASNNQKNTAK